VAGVNRDIDVLVFDKFIYPDSEGRSCKPPSISIVSHFISSLSVLAQEHSLKELTRRRIKSAQITIHIGRCKDVKM
jgi:hypothetical protein